MIFVTSPGDVPIACSAMPAVLFPPKSCECQQKPRRPEEGPNQVHFIQKPMFFFFSTNPRRNKHRGCLFKNTENGVRDRFCGRIYGFQARSFLEPCGVPKAADVSMENLLTRPALLKMCGL